MIVIDENPIMPLFYHGPMRSTEERPSDRRWVKSRMAILPREMQQEIASRYETLYMQAITSDGRQRANTYLQRKAQPYIDELKASRNKK